MYHPPRGGVRGGADLFSWDSVKTDKHRENYLGHSLMAPVGRWQKGKDLSWYSKERKNEEVSQDRMRELNAIKQSEEEAMLVALGLEAPKRTADSSKEEENEVSKQNQSSSIAENEQSAGANSLTSKSLTNKHKDKKHKKKKKKKKHKHNSDSASSNECSEPLRKSHSRHSNSVKSLTQYRTEYKTFKKMESGYSKKMKPVKDRGHSSSTSETDNKSSDLSDKESVRQKHIKRKSSKRSSSNIKKKRKHHHQSSCSSESETNSESNSISQEKKLQHKMKDANRKSSKSERFSPYAKDKHKYTSHVKREINYF